MAKSGYDLYLDWLADRNGGFYKNLIGAIVKADKRNVVKLATVYPELVHAHKLYNEVGLNEFLEHVDNKPLAELMFPKAETEEVEKENSSELRNALGWG